MQAMRKVLSRAAKTALRVLGLEVVRSQPALVDLSEQEQRIIERVAPFTLTTPERIAALIAAIRYIERYKIEGDIVECGVFRGGSMMAAALALKQERNSERRLYLYDTFSGMSKPTKEDVDFRGYVAAGPGDAAVSLDEVKRNLSLTGFPLERMQFIKGPVEQTIPGTLPKEIAILRLDTDWYESTRHELEHLYPLVSRNGVLIIDDYGHWRGSQKAVDEFFATRDEPVFLHRIDYTGRLVIKSNEVRLGKT